MILLTHAWQEVRQHPSRFAATLLAIVVSVAFLAATQVYGDTESNAIKQRQALYASKADIIAESHLWHSPSARWQRNDGLDTVERLLDQRPEVAHHERFSRLFTQVIAGDRAAGVTLTSMPSETFRWFTLVEGRLPRGYLEIVLTKELAATLGVGVGDQVRLNVKGLKPLTVVGLTDESGYSDPPAYAQYQLLLEVDSLFPPPNYNILLTPDDNLPGSSGDGIGISVMVKLKDAATTDVDKLVAEVQQGLLENAILRIIVHLKTADQVRAEAAQAVTAKADWLSWILGGAGALSLLFGVLIIATTFSILIAQRRRQVGLLRAVGASRGQVVRRFAAESLLLGVLGTAIGVPLGLGLAAAASSVGSHSIRFGLVIDWTMIVLIATVGVIATVLASLIPIRGATKVRPIEALQPVTNASDSRLRPVLIGLICAVTGVAGVIALWLGIDLTQPILDDHRIGSVVLGGAGLALAILVSSSLWVPAVTRLIGRGLRRARPEVRLAVANTGRNPTRVGATATSLMLAVGLMVAVQVGAATGQAGAFAMVDKRFPVDIALQSALPPPEQSDPANGQGELGERDANGDLVGFSKDALEITRSTPGVAKAEVFQISQPMAVQLGHVYDQYPITTLTPEAQSLLAAPIVLALDQIGISSTDMEQFGVKAGASASVFPLVGDLTGEVGPQFLTVIELNLGTQAMVVHPETFAKLAPGSRSGLILVKIDDPRQAATVLSALTARLTPDNPGLDLGGGAELKANVAKVLDGVALLLTGLLAVAALVALIGVSNTLGLSVMERTRESALLRALGLQRRGLRVMLLVEAVLLSVISIVVGVAAGVLLGWAGAVTIAHALSWPAPPLTVDWPMALITCVGVLAAGVLGSVLPGRRAAMASPVDALADVG